MIGLALGALAAGYLAASMRAGRRPDLRAAIPAEEFRSRAQSYADLLPYALRIRHDVVLNVDGSFTATYAYRGQDLESASRRTLGALSTRVNQTFRRFGAGWMFQVDSDRHPAIGYPIDSRFPDRVAWIIDEERRAEFEQTQAHYVTDYLLHVTYMPPSDRSRAAWNFFIDARADAAMTPASEALKTFDEGLAFLESMLGDELSLRRLGVRTTTTPQGDTQIDDQLSTFIRCATNRRIEVAARPPQTWLAPIVACENLRNGFALRIGNHVLNVIAIDGVPATSYPGILDILDFLDASYRANWRFIVIDKRDAEREIGKIKTKWFGQRRSVLKAISDDESGFQNVDAIRMADDANEALAQISSDEACCGYFSMSVVIWEAIAPNEKEETAAIRLRAKTERIAAAIDKLHFVTRIEQWNALEAFLGTLPGIAHAQVRRPMLSSRNFSDFIPTTSVWTGTMHCPSPLYPPDSPPLAYVSTARTTPFALNIHVGDVGHTLIAGATGGGKSALMGFLLAQHRRYPGARQIVLDVGYSHYTLCAAVEGKHYDLAAEGLRLCPLAHIDDPMERQWAETWVASLAEARGLDPRQFREHIYLALEGLAASGSPRSLSALAMQGLPHELREAILTYTVANSALPILDGERDEIELSDFTCFELQALQDLGPALLRPLLEYLFHAIGTACKGQPTILAVEEVWRFLDNPQAAEALNEWLRTMRKRNVAVVFASQSISDLAECKISNALLGSCLTKIYVANPEAESPSEMAQYLRAGLTPWQCKMLARATRKRDYYIVSPEGRRMIELELGAVSRCFVGVSAHNDIKRIRALIAEERAHLQAHPEGPPPINWQLRWMSERLAAEIGLDATQAWIRHFIDGQASARATTPLPVEEAIA
jgi:type IV secretion/conjugal transfer VirB4 family ATPase